MRRGRRRRGAALALAGATVLAAGCGADTGGDARVATARTAAVETAAPVATSGGTVSAPATVPAAPAPAPVTTPGVTARPEVAAVRAVLQRYVEAFVAADGATACGLLTEESARAFLLAVGDTVGAATCAAAFTAVTEQVPQEQRDAFRAAVIGDLVVTGDTARGTLTVGGASNDLRLERRSGSWRIANPPGQ